MDKEQKKLERLVKRARWSYSAADSLGTGGKVLAVAGLMVLLVGGAFAIHSDICYHRIENQKRKIVEQRKKGK